MLKSSVLTVKVNANETAYLSYQFKHSKADAFEYDENIRSSAFTLELEPDR